MTLEGRTRRTDGRRQNTTGNETTKPEGLLIFQRKPLLYLTATVRGSSIVSINVIIPSHHFLWVGMSKNERVEPTIYCRNIPGKLTLPSSWACNSTNNRFHYVCLVLRASRDFASNDSKRKAVKFQVGSAQPCEYVEIPKMIHAKIKIERRVRSAKIKTIPLVSRMKSCTWIEY